MTFKTLCTLALVACAPALRAGDSWQFQVLHTAQATAANVDKIWSVKFPKITDKAVVRYRVFVSGSEATGHGETLGQTELPLPSSGAVPIPTHGTVVFTYDRGKCSFGTRNHGIAFEVRDSAGRAARFHLDRTPAGKPALISPVAGPGGIARTQGVLKLTAGAKSHTGFTTIALLKDDLPE